MLPFTTIAAVVLATSVSTVAAGVTLYEDIYFGGRSATVYSWAPQRCITLSCWGDMASSASWSDIDPVGDFGGHSYIAFFTDSNCKGEQRRWRIDEPNFPNNFVIDGINDAVSSFMVMRSPGSISYDRICPYSGMEVATPLNGSESMAAANATRLRTNNEA